MKKNIILIIGLLTVCCWGCISCSDDEVYDFPGDTVNRVYLKSLDNTVNGFDKTSIGVMKTPANIFYSTLKFPVTSTLMATSDILVSFSIDHSLVDSYNEKYETDYKELPSGVADLKNNELKIPANSMVSKEMLEITLNKENLSNLNVGEYLLALKIEQVIGDAQISSNRNMTYVRIVVSEDTDNIWDTEADEATKGYLLDKDRANWTINTVNSSFGDDISKLLDGDANSYLYYGIYSWDDNTGFTVDLQQEYDNISGIYQQYYSGDYAILSMDVFTSSDNTTWTYQGHFDNNEGIANICFYSPVKARYIKTVVRETAYNVYMKEINIYVKD